MRKFSTFDAASLRWLRAAVAVMAALAILAALNMDVARIDAWRVLHWICKPLATLLILLLAWSARPPVSSRYRVWILVGILCSCGGDVCLMLPGDLFVPGLVAFLLAHLCFLLAFLGDSRFAGRPPIMLACLAYGAINLWLLWPSIAAPLRIPVIVYVAVLAGMAGQAMVRARIFAAGKHALATSARKAAIGAALFLLSDSVLAWNRFHAPIPWADLWVLWTYYLSLWWIARSVQRDGMTTAGAAT
jgi:uncharacterized membrane protein YhhN